jgi:hypothetical protein
MRKEIKIMQLFRVPPLGKLVVEVNDQRYQELAHVTDENIRRLLLAAVGELVSFAGGYEVLVDAGMAPAPSRTPVTDAAAQSVAASKSRQQQQEEFLASLQAETEALRNTAPLREPSLLGRLRPAPPPEIPPPPASEDSIVEQIDAILQKYVAAEADLAHRSIHLEQDPSGGLRIEVDGTYYQKPAQIGEKKIQLCIKRTLKEWESA